MSETVMSTGAMRTRLAATALGAALILGACGPTSGTVSDKAHGDAYTWYMPTCMSYGKAGCSVWVLVPVDEPDRWYLTVQAGDEYGRCQVPKETWDRTSVGDQLIDCGRGAA